MSGQERRASPRIRDEGLALKLDAGNFDIVTHTLNLSSSGIYCKVQKQIPIMSRVKLVLQLPDISKGGGGLNNISLEGVVVREHPVIIDGQVRHYDCAIFFDGLPSKTKEAISDYITNKAQSKQT